MATRAKVSPRTSSPTHTISLSDGTSTYGLILDGGVRAIQESPQTPSTLYINSQGGQFGDFDPSMSHVQQADWRGGRGSERFFDDNTRYFDSKNMWTLGDGMIYPSLQWKYATGYRNQDMYQLGKSYELRSMAAGLAYAHGFTASASYSADKCYVWVKKVGNPGSLTLSIYANSANKPTGAALATITNDGSLLENGVITYLPMDWTSTIALTSATMYHVVVKGAATDTSINHWEILTANSSGTTYAYTSPDLTNWTATTYKLYFRVVDADTDQQFKFFKYQSDYYAASIPAAASGSKLFLLGTTANTEANSTGSDISLTEKTSTGLTKITDVLVSNGFVYFAQGESTAIKRWNGTTYVDDGSNKATLLYNYSDPTEGPTIWRTNLNTISRSLVKSSGNLTFNTAITVGHNLYNVNQLCSYNDSLWVFKDDSLWSMRNGKAYRLDIGLENMISTNNGQAAIAHGVYLYFSYVSSLEQLYGSTLSDVGPAHGAGLPLDRTGRISALLSVLGKLFVAIDGQTSNYSSVMVYDGINYHEIWRAPEIGKRIRSMFWKPGTDGTAPYLYIDYGGDIIYLKFPAFGFQLIRDTGVYYAPDAHLITSTIDLNATRLPKMFKEITVIGKNLTISNNKAGSTRSSLITSNSRISLDYQADDDIGSSNWTYAGDFLTSPQSTVSLNIDSIYSIRFRMRFQISDAANPPIITASLVEGMARTPIKYQWVIRAKTSSIQSTLTGAQDYAPDKLLKWLQEKASKAEKLVMHSTLSSLDSKFVMAEPPAVIREFNDPKLKSWGGTITMVLRET